MMPLPVDMNVPPSERLSAMEQQRRENKAAWGPIDGVEDLIRRDEAEDFLATLRALVDEHGEKVVMAGVALWLLEVIGDDDDEEDD